jgi:hypothetical protein
MAELAAYGVDDYGDPGGFTYGLNPSNGGTWDAHMIQGCLCDKFG